MRKEVAFILGAMEDGNLSSRPEIGDFTIEIEQKNKEWLITLARYFRLAFKVKPKISARKKKNVFRLRIYSKDVFQKLQKLRNEKQEITKERKEVQKYYLRGIFDAEGSVDKNKYRITLSNKNLKLLKTCKKLLAKLGIETGKIWEYKWGVKVLPVLGKEKLKIFKKEVGFSHPAKKLKLVRKLMLS